MSNLLFAPVIVCAGDQQATTVLCGHVGMVATVRQVQEV